MRGLAGAVAVVEQVLGQGLVDGHDRERERAVRGHRPEADDAGGGLLGAGQDLGQLVAALLVEQRDEVAAVVHRDRRVGVGDGPQVRVVGGVVLAPARVGGDAVLDDQRRRGRRPAWRAGSTPRGGPPRRPP